MNQFNTDQRVFAFIDILGFKETLDSKSQSEQKELFQDYSNCLENAVQKTIQRMDSTLKKLNPTHNKSISSRLMTHQFTDNLCLSMSYDSEGEFEDAVLIIFILCAIYQTEMLGINQFVRGGIAHGQAIVSEKAIFSNALVRAYEIESKVSIYPRICIDEPTLVELLKHNGKDYFNESLKTLLIEDWEELVFINPIGFTLGVLDSLSENRDQLIELLELADADVQKVPRADNLKHELQRTQKTFIRGIRELVENKVSINSDNHHVRSKFLWTLQYIDHCTGSKPTSLVFKSIEDILHRLGSSSMAT